MQVAAVKFNGGQKLYYYFYEGFDLSIGDFVVVNSPVSGYTVVQVVETDVDMVKSAPAFEWIVCRVDNEAYINRKEKIERKSAIEARIRKSVEEAMKRAQIEQMLQFMTEEERKLYEEYKSL